MFERGRNGDQIFWALGETLYHKPMATDDAMLGEAAPEAEVGLTRLTGGTVVGAADRRDDELTRCQCGDVVANLGDSAQDLVTEDQGIAAGRRCTEMTINDLFISATDADLVDGHKYLVRGERWCRNGGQVNASGVAGMDGDAGNGVVGRHLVHAKPPLRRKRLDDRD